MKYPSININDIPDLNGMVSALNSSIDSVSNVGTDELLIIVATYFWESAFTSSMIF